MYDCFQIEYSTALVTELNFSSSSAPETSEGMTLVKKNTWFQSLATKVPHCVKSLWLEWCTLACSEAT